MLLWASHAGGCDAVCADELDSKHACIPSIAKASSGRRMSVALNISFTSDTRASRFRHRSARPDSMMRARSVRRQSRHARIPTAVFFAAPDRSGKEPRLALAARELDGNPLADAQVRNSNPETASIPANKTPIRFCAHAGERNPIPNFTRRCGLELASLEAAA